MMLPFLTGSQYHRYPTPEPKYWERDLAHLKRLGFDFIQLRPQWRQIERIEGRYDWANEDRLFELARKHGLTVIFKFLLETGPEWLFDNYKAFRIGPDGAAIPVYGNGSYYIGGMIPCFDHPMVKGKAAALVKNAVQRYQSAGNLLAWHAWNEPRNRPYGECACPHSLDDFRGWLKARFGTVEGFNAAFGLAETSLESVKAPNNPEQYSLVALWKEWGRKKVADRIALVADTIRALDRSHPVLCHSGMCSLTQDILNDGSDDTQNAKTVDIYGVSYIHWAGEYVAFNHLEREASLVRPDWRSNQFQYAMMADWMRANRRPFWINEFYSDSWSAETPHFTAEDIRFRLYEAVSSGARGINLWQFRPEVFCNETGITGLINPDGNDTPRSLELKAFNEFKNENAALLNDYEKDRGDVAIVYDPESDIISRLEHPGKPAKEYCVSYRYKNSVKGWHSLCWRNGLNPDFVPATELERTHDYPAVILPCPSRFPENAAPILKKYVRNGGVLFSEPGLSMRDSRNWLNEILPPYGLDELFGLRHGLLKGGRLPNSLYTKAFGKGRTFYFGEFPGERVFLEPRFNLKKIVDTIRKAAGLKPSFTAQGLVIVKRGKSLGNKVAFILNYEKSKNRVRLLPEKQTLTLPGRSVKMVVTPLGTNP